MSEALASPPPLSRLFEAIRPKRRTDEATARPVNQLDRLVERLQQGDDSALEAFIEATQTMAHRLAFSILHDRDRCQDVLQEVYLTVYQKIGQLQNPAALRGWFSQILVNRCRQELRGRRHEGLEDHPEPQAPDLAHEVERRLDVQSAMASLPVDDRTVLTLREVCDLSYQDIAENLQLPLGTVRSRIFNARQRLLAALTGRPHLRPSSRDTGKKGTNR